MNTKPAVDLRIHNLRVVAEALTPRNVRGTSKEFKHSPNTDTTEGRNELVLHLIHSGLAPHFKPETT